MLTGITWSGVCLAFYSTFFLIYLDWWCLEWYNDILEPVSRLYHERTLSPSVFIPQLQRSWKGGILVSPCPSVHPSVRPSVCEQNRVRFVSSTILVGSISYSHISSSNFRWCVACKFCFKIKKKKWNFGKLFKFVTLTLSSFDLGSNMTQ